MKKYNVKTKRYDKFVERFEGILLVVVIPLSILGIINAIYQIAIHK